MTPQYDCAERFAFHRTFSDLLSDRSPNPATARRNQAYAELLAQGWRWQTNAGPNDVVRYSKDYARARLDVCVTEQAFDNTGQRVKGMVAILTKPKA
jgi:hypothetical protein